MPLYVKGTDLEIYGTLETIEGTALVSGRDDEGDPIYVGETKVDWNSQKSLLSKDEKRIWIATDGSYHSDEEIEDRDCRIDDKDFDDRVDDAVHAVFAAFGRTVSPDNIRDAEALNELITQIMFGNVEPAGGGA